MKRPICLGCPSFERSGMHCHRSPTSVLAGMSSHCFAALPAKIPAFKSHPWQNAWLRNLQWTF